MSRLAGPRVYLAAAGLIAMVLLVLAEISTGLLSRVIPAMPSGMRLAWEYSAYLMGSAFMFDGARTLRSGMQIRVELLLRAWQGRFERPLEIFSSLVGAVFLGVLAWSLAAFTSPSRHLHGFCPAWLECHWTTTTSKWLLLENNRTETPR